VFGGTQRWVRVATTEPVRVMVQKNGNDKLLARIVYAGPVRAPIEAGQRIGTIKVWRGANVAVEEPLYALDSVATGTTMQRAFDGASELMIGMFRAGIEKL
jgi:D-alanyl-D-alanine carboxypeptidase (penicillin-binding protein 5/6)